MGRVIVGAPVHERAWILDRWFSGLATQWEFPAEEISVFLNYGHSEDRTLEIARKAQVEYGFHSVLILEDTGLDHVAERDWNQRRYGTMVRLRNALLDYVRKAEPEYYLSCDTDMLLPPETLLKLTHDLGRIGADGIAPLTYMTPKGTQFPNCMDRGGFTRPPVQADTFLVGACFGTVLMTPRLYQDVDYSEHPNGEDLGWAENARRAGLTLALTPHVKAKHVMHPDLLDEFDERVGF